MTRRIAVYLLCALPFLVAAPARARPVRPRDFQAEAMVVGTAGWAQTGQGLYWTDDGGADWRNITPPLEHPARLGSVRFEDAERGWAMAEEGGERHSRTVLFTTTDGGRSWRRAPIEVKGLLTIAAGAYFAPVGPGRTYALVSEARNTAYSIGYLFVTRDGGRHWRQLATQPPHAGPIVFTNPSDGWLAGGGPHPALYRTRDGGRSWAEVRPPRPPELAEASAGYLPPQFEPDGHGILAAAYDKLGAKGTAALYTTDDFGDHWALARSARLSIETSGPGSLAYRGGDSVIAEGFPPPRLELLSTGAPTRALAGTGLPGMSLPYLSFSGPEDGFAEIDSQECVRKTDCTVTNQLYFTADGGEDWTLATRP